MNVARGALVDLAALSTLLQSGHIAAPRSMSSSASRCHRRGLMEEAIALMAVAQVREGRRRALSLGATKMRGHESWQRALHLLHGTGRQHDRGLPRHALVREQSPAFAMPTGIWHVREPRFLWL